MTPGDVGSLLGSLVGGVLGLLLVLALFVALFGWPLLVFSAVRSLRRIAAALEALSDTRAAAPRPAHRESEIGPWQQQVTAARSPASSAEPSR